MKKIAWFLLAVGLLVLVLYGSSVGEKILRAQIVRSVQPNTRTTTLTRHEAWWHIVAVSVIPAVGLAMLLWGTTSPRFTLKTRLSGTACLVYGCLVTPAAFLPFRDIDKIALLAVVGAFLAGLFLAMLSPAGGPQATRHRHAPRS